jgi:hypothetical protein
LAGAALPAWLAHVLVPGQLAESTTAVPHDSSRNLGAQREMVRLHEGPGGGVAQSMHALASTMFCSRLSLTST